MSSEELEQEQDAGGLGPAEVNAEEGSDSLREPMSGQRLSEEGRLLKAIVESLPDMVFVKEARELRFVRLNRAGESLLGYGREELLGKNDFDFFPQDEAEAFVKKDREVLDARQQVEIPQEPILTQNGKRILRTKKVPIVDDEGQVTHLLGISEDITEQLETQKQLQRVKDDLIASKSREAQKLELLGIVAGGVSHDFNNLLVGILGNVSLLQEENLSAAEQLELTGRIEAAARRASELTRQILAYSGKGHFVSELCDVSLLLKELCTLLTSSIDKKTTLKMRLAGQVIVQADPSQLRQLFMNLVTNASESYEGSPGQVSVELTEVYFDSEDEAESYQIGSVSRGKYHCITITDAGCGMAPETSARIFEPFFSTKDSGHGLGLAAVSGIITGHQGALSVQTQVGGGTKVSVLLPAAKGVAAMAMIANTQVSLTGKRILVIDDESMIRQVVKRALSREGVRVTTARDGQEGLKVFQEAPDDFDVLLVDLTMPGLDGKQVMTAARQLRPACRIVLSSGYNQGDSSVLLKERIRFLPKPYTAPELIAVLQSALEETNERTDFS